MLNSFDDIKDRLNEIIKFSVKEKETSLFMRFLAFFMFFNKNFLTNFVTTVGKTIYFPKKYFETNNSRIVLCHEFRHIYDYNKYSILFFLGYFFPQILAIFALLGFIHWGFLFFILMLVPIPSYFRYKFELNGYLAGLFVTELLLKNKIASKGLDLLLKKQADAYEQHFKDNSYYFMWPFKIGLYEKYKKINKNEDFYLKIQAVIE